MKDKHKKSIHDKKLKSILIIGISGGLAQSTCQKIIENDPNIKIIGVDNRMTNIALPKQVEARKIRYNRSHFEKLFREASFDCVIHLARISHSENILFNNYENRLNFNLLGTKTILDLSLKFKIKKLIFLSTFHVYGALSDNPVYINENAALRASLNYPELRDVVEMDQIVTSWMWQNQNNLDTIILRPCNIIGPSIHNTITEYLLTPLAPIPIDFNPTFQFIHEEDMASIIENSVYKLPLGVYNCSPDKTITLSQINKIHKIIKSKIPIFFVKQLAKILNTPIWRFPLYLLDYITYSSIIDSRLLMSNLPDFQFKFTPEQTLESIKKSKK